MTCLEIKVVYKMRQKCFLKSRLKSALIFEVKFMSCLKIKVKFFKDTKCVIFRIGLELNSKDDVRSAIMADQVHFPVFLLTKITGTFYLISIS